MATEPELVRGSERSPISAGGAIGARLQRDAAHRRSVLQRDATHRRSVAMGRNASALGCNGTQRIGARLQRDATQRNLSAATGNRQGAPFINLKGIAIGDGAMDPPSQFANFSSLLWYLGTHARAHARTHACAVSPHTRAHLTPGRRSHAHTHPRPQARTNAHIDTRPRIGAAPRVEHAHAATLLRAQVPRHGLALRAQSVRELRGANSGAPRGALAAATAAPRLHPPLPYVRWDWAHSATHLRRGSARRCRIGTRIRLAAATSAPGLGYICARTGARRSHICIGTRLVAATSAPGLGSPLQHLHRDCSGCRPAICSARSRRST